MSAWPFSQALAFRGRVPEEGGGAGPDPPVASDESEDSLADEALPHRRYHLTIYD